jgi:primosomal protein N' (replication factor Y)
MRLLSVVPIAKGIFRENLSYFTSKDLGPGALVEVPVRKKIIPAIVISSQELKTAKTNLRQADFALKSIKTVKAEKFLLPNFMEACKEISDYFLAPIGSVIKDLVPGIILDNPTTLSANHAESKTGASKFFETIAIQGNNEERAGYYKNIIREEFARGRSVFVCLPAVSDIENMAPGLQKGIEKYAVVMHSGMNNKKIKELWSFALKESHPLLIIATRSFLSLPKEDIGTLIIDGESSSFYKLQTRPYLDIRRVAEIIARKEKLRLIFGDVVLRAETGYKHQSASSQRIISGAEQEIVSEEELKKKIKEAVANPPAGGEKIILFANRRGYSPITVCKDCYRPILCEKCDSPLVLHKKEGNPAWLCHKCLKETIAPERCPYCQSWKLEEYGSGIRKTADEMKKSFPKINIFIIDSDAVKTKKEGEEIARNFLATTGGAILIGTEMMFSFISQPADITAIVSIDPLFTFPDFRINEKIFRLIARMRTLAKKKFYIHTKMLEHKTIIEAIKGNVSGFHRAELEARKESGYPPFSLLIKITGENANKIKLKKDIDELEKKLTKWRPLSYSSFTPKIKGKYEWNILLKIEPESWPNNQKELHTILSSLSPAWKINIDPESLL